MNGNKDDAPLFSLDDLDIDSKIDISATSNAAIARYNNAVEMESLLLLADWPHELGEPHLVYGPNFKFLGLGTPGEVVLHAQPNPDYHNHG